MIPKLKFKVGHILILLMIIGFFFRVYFLNYQSFWIDEAFSVNAAQGILNHGYPLLDSGVVYWRSILNSYLIASFMGLFGDSHFSTRFVSVIFGTLTIPLIYYFGRELGNKKIGLIAAVLVTFSFWEIAWSRQARMYQQLQFFYFLSLLLFYRLTNNFRFKTLLLVVLFTILTILSHTLGFTLFLIYATYILIINIKNLFRIKEIAKDILNDFKEELSKFYTEHKVIFVIFSLFLLISSAYIIFLLIGAIINLPDVNRNYFDAYVYYLDHVHFLFYYFAFIGAILSLKNFRKGLLLILAYLIPFYFVSHYIILLHFRYVYFILPILFILSAHTILYLVNFGKFFKKYEKFASIAIILIITWTIFSQSFVFIPNKEYRLEVQTPQPNFEKAYSFINENMNENDTIIASYPAVSKYYTSKADYWIEFSLSGFSNISRYIIEDTNKEIYANATIISDLNSFKEVISSERGWVVIDKMAWRRIDPEIKEFISSDLVYYANASEEKNIWSGISVYKWG